MRSILAAIGAALRGAFAVIRDVVMLPVDLLSSMFGGPLGPPPAGDSPLVAELKAKTRAAQGEAIPRAAEAMAKVVSNWSMDCIIDDRRLPVPTPPRVSRDVANWLQGLTSDECVLIAKAQINAISAHIAGTAHIDGLRAVQRLEAEPWESLAIVPSWGPTLEPQPVIASAPGVR
ncbi:hypothetical protein SSBR45G_46640 [Bradyrhizobium sp. SSBR45G]|uniref:hypothetical protein n=1 Tax=unclassified Bradyrhizobium TaxID=2631580 RepID=UPI002342A8A5|nr:MULTISPECIES: hypothetical protein [unclassified Bradyrhizobium]GLH79755.1 hypothetical protein SSBR45G_46640 [Bradyrhizobium sp. SSBR45G]GLH87127.1 hypothetical protein SSBR45R_45870 [Bradyrhizobium sp. SSBR45R]